MYDGRWRNLLLGRHALLNHDLHSAGLFFGRCRAWELAQREKVEAIIDLARYLLRARHEFAPTLIWIEHDMQLVRDLADRIVVLHYGEMLPKARRMLPEARVVEPTGEPSNPLFP